MAVLMLLFAVLFTGTVAFEDCTSYNDSRGVLVSCSLWTPQFTHEFCCGTCDEIYCCDDPRLKLTKDVQNGCLFKTVKYSSHSRLRLEDHRAIGVTVPIVMFMIAIIVFIICFCHEKSIIRNHPHVTSTTVTTTQYHPQGSQYSAYQSVPNNPQPVYRRQPMPTGTSEGWPYVPGPPPTYQEAAGYPVPFSQAPQPPLPTDYTSPQPAYNPAYVELTKTGY